MLRLELEAQVAADTVDLGVVDVQESISELEVGRSAEAEADAGLDLPREERAALVVERRDRIVLRADTEPPQADAAAEEHFGLLRDVERDEPVEHERRRVQVVDRTDRALGLALLV